ncbi:MAG: hypothetical protein ACE5JR_06580 [Gemmatimonadota bacterium]
MQLPVASAAIGLLAVGALPSLLPAQQAHVLEESELQSAVAQKASESEADREAIRQTLGRTEVSAVAERYGIDLARAEDAVGTLEGQELRRVASEASRVEAVLAGGEKKVVISTTAIIIGLLVLILILVA